MLIVDPVTNTADTTSLDGLVNLSGGLETDKWWGSILGLNGMIYCVPHNSEVVMIIDPASGVVDTTTLTGLIGGAKWSGGATGPDGKIYTIPWDSVTVMVIDPATGTMDTTSMGGLSAANMKWRGGILAPNGVLYGLPHGESAILKIQQPSNRQFIVAGCEGSPTQHCVFLFLL